MKITPYKREYTTPYYYIDFFKKTSDTSCGEFLSSQKAADELLGHNINITFDLDIFQKYTYIYIGK